MKIFIPGIDGYLGWTLALYLAERGYEVGGMDNLKRRRVVEQFRFLSAIPIARMSDRLEAFKDRFGKDLWFSEDSTHDYDALVDCLKEFQPDTIVHLAEIPSAPYSMLDRQFCNYTHHNNLIGTLNLLYAMKEHCPEAHLIKLGTMGEYGTPNIDIPEGHFEIEYNGRKDILPFPKQAGSWYHLTKVHDTNNLIFACKIWGLRATDIHQGPVYGTRINEMGEDKRLATRFDFDHIFGTSLNRFCAQAVINHKLTVYGKGGQKRGYILLEDAMQCIQLVIDNPTDGYRTLNQFDGIYSVYNLADAVKTVGETLGLKPEIECIKNPRIEKEEHYYNPDNQGLKNLGYVPSKKSLDDELKIILEHLLEHKDRIEEKRDFLYPSIYWDKTSNFQEAK